MAGDFGPLYACHCRECQKQSASAFGMSLVVARSNLTLLRGAPLAWARGTGSGRRLTCRFCGNCGSRLWHERDEGSATVTVKAGSLDVPVDASAAIHIWTARKLRGVTIPEGAASFPGEPPWDD